MTETQVRGYPIGDKPNPTPGQYDVVLPRGAQLLDVGDKPQGGDLLLYAFVDPSETETEVRHILLVDEGDPIPCSFEELRFVCMTTRGNREIAVIEYPFQGHAGILR